MIHLDRLVKRYRGRRAIDGVSLDVGAREIVGLLGPNGAGKSTLLGMVLGLVRPDAGTAWIDGTSVQRHPARARRRLGAAVAAAAFEPRLSGWQNLARLASWSGGATAAEMRRAVEFAGLDGCIDDHTRTYSRGMLLRLALAQALVPRPAAVVLDEPLEGLDPAGLGEVCDLLARVRDEWGAAVLMSSHLLDEVEALADRVAILHEGRLAAVVSPRETDACERRWRLDVDDWPRAVTVLAARGVGMPEPRVVILAPHDDLGDVVAALAGAGVRVHDVTPVRTGLAERYLAVITGR